MTDYTVEIQASAPEVDSFGETTGFRWQALHPAGTYLDGDSPEKVARDVAVHQHLAEGPGWRVVVWDGANADTGVEPTFVLAAGEPVGVLDVNGNEIVVGAAVRVDGGRPDVDWAVRAVLESSGVRPWHVVVARRVTDGYEGQFRAAQLRVVTTVA
jgi:hypothetical protein